LETQTGTKSLLTVQKASEIYGLDASLIYHWIRYKKFDHHKVGKKILFWKSDFLEFLEQHRVKNNGELEN
jgi:excisionase family DNA binding protein